MKGLIRCGECGYVKQGSTFEGKKKTRSYYRCLALPKERRSEKCHASYTKKAEIEELVWNEIKKIIQQPELIRAALAVDSEPRFTEKDTRVLDKQIVSLQKEKDRILTAFRKGIIDLEDLQKEAQKIEKEKENLEEQRKAIKACLESEALQERIIEESEDYYRKFQARIDEMAFQEKRKAVELIIHEVIVPGNGGVEIVFNLPESYKLFSANGNRRRICEETPKAGLIETP